MQYAVELGSGNIAQNKNLWLEDIGAFVLLVIVVVFCHNKRNLQWYTYIGSPKIILKCVDQGKCCIH